MKQHYKLTFLLFTSQIRAKLPMKSQLVVFGCMLMCQFVLLTSLRGQSPITQNPLATSCDDLIISSISTRNESSCGSKDGAISINLSDDSGLASTYSIEAKHGDKPLNLNGLPIVNGVLKITALAPGRYNSFKIIRESDSCSTVVESSEQFIKHGCDFENIDRSMSCGSGTISYTNCDGDNITLNKSNFSADSYIWVDDYFVGCIAYVDGSCNVQPSVPVFCGDVNLSEPTPDQGYSYGDVTFTRVVGASVAGYTDLQAERANWAMCNGPDLGYSDYDINYAIWYLLDNSNFNNCNALCSAAEAAVPSVTGGIAGQMIFFLPDNSSIQPFVENECYIACNINAAITVPSSVCEGDAVTIMAANCNQITYNSQVTASANDSYETNNGDNQPSNYESGNIQTRGFRFVNLNIPAGAIINSATLTLTGYSGSGSTNVRIKAHDQAAPAAFSNQNNYLSNLYNNSSTSNAIDWAIPAPSNGDQLVSPNLSSILQEMVDTYGGLTHVSLLMNRLNSGQLILWNFDDGANYANFRPVLNVTYDTPDGSSSNCAYSWTFSGGTPSSSTEQSPTVSWNTPGIKTVQLTVSTPDGCSDTEQVNITVNEGISSPGTISGNQTNCGPFDPAEITNITAASGGNCGALVINDDDTCDTGDKPVEFTLAYIGGDCPGSNPNQPDDKWECTGSAVNLSSVYITINDNQFSGTVTLGSSFIVDNGGSKLSNPIEISIYDSQGGSQLQYLEIHTSCSAPIVIGSTFGALQLLGVVYQNGETFDQSSISGITYQWQQKNPSGAWTDISGATGQTYDPSTITATTQYRRVASNCCASQNSNVITKSVNPAVSVDAGADDSICEGESVTITASANGGTAPYVFSWNNGLGNGATKIVSPNATTIYEVTVVDANGCTATDDLVVTVQFEVTDGGTIGNDESECASYDPAEIINISGASGGNCGFSGGNGDDTCDTGDKPVEFTLAYIGGDCPSSNPNQPDNKWECTGSAVNLSSVYITINDNQFSGTVTLGSSFTVQNGGDKLTNPIEISIYDTQGGTELQYLEIHTSCSAPIVIGSTFGALQLLGVEYQNGVIYDPAAVTGTTYQWQYRVGTSGAWLDISGATSTSYDPSIITATTQYRRIASNCCGSANSNIVTKEVIILDPGQISGNQTICGSYDPSVISSVNSASGECTITDSNGDDTCDTGDKPVEFTLAYIGGDCPSSNPNQPDNKWECTGSAVNLSSVYITINDNQFSGTVTLGSSFTVQNGGDKLTNPIEISIYDTQGGTELQYLEIHTSCSAPIVLGSTFGALQLLGVEYENGVTFDPIVTDVAYQWQQKVTGGPWVDISGATGETYDPPFITETMRYRRVATNCCNSEFSNVVIKLVQLIPISAITSIPSSICEGEIVNFEAADCTGTTTSQDNFTYNAQVTASANDSYQTNNGDNKPSDYESGNIQTRGFRFVNLNIPAGAIINNATLTLTGYSGSGSTNVRIKGHDQAAPAAFSNQNNYLSNLYNNSSTSSAIDWTIPAPSDGDQLVSPDLGPILQEIVDTYGGLTHISLLMNRLNSGQLILWNFDDGANYAGFRPVLNVSYSTFDQNTSNITCDYLWTFPGGNPATSTEQFPTVSWNTPGSKTVELTVGTSGCQSTYTTTIEVETSPSVSVSSTDATCGNNNGSITFTFSDDPDRSSIEFSIDGGTTYTINSPDNVGSITIDNLAPATYDLWARWGNGECPVDLPDATINGTDGPSVDAGNDMTICEGESATLSASATNGSSPYAFEWDNGLGTGASQTVSPVPSAFANETFIYTVTATDANGCTDVDQVSVSVLSTPDVTTSSTNPTCGDDNGSITFTFPDHPDRSSIEFSVDGGATYTLSSADNVGSVTLSDLDAGTYDLWVRWGNDACPIDIPNITLNDENGPSVTASDDAAICVGSSVNLSANATGGTGTITYTWTPGNLSGASVNVSPTTTTTYTVIIEDENGCTANDQVTVTIVEDPEVMISADESEICVGETINFTATTSGGLDCQEVQWQFRPGTSGAWTNLTTGNSYITDADLLAGTYQYRARFICNGIGCDNDNSNIITITINDILQVNAGIDQNICEGEIVNLSGSIGGGATSAVWTTSGTGVFNPSNSSLVTIYSPSQQDYDNGEVTLTLTANNPSGACPSVSDDAMINFDQNGGIDAGDDQEICEGESVNLSGMLETGVSDPVWTTSGDGSFSDINDLNATYTPGNTDMANGLVTLTLSGENSPFDQAFTQSEADFYTVNSGNWNQSSTWANGNIPPGDLNNKKVLITHDINVTDRNIKLQNGSILYADGVDFIMYQSYNFTVEVGQAGFVNCTFIQQNNSPNNTPSGGDGDGNLEITTSNGELTMIGCEVWVAQNFQNSQGQRTLIDVCLKVDENYINIGTDYLERVCMEVAYEEFFLSSGSGNFQNDGPGNMTVIDVDVHTYNGNFQNKSSASISGNFGAIWVENGNLQNDGSWNASVDDQLCVDQNIQGNYSPPLPTENCNNIADFFCDCSGGGSNGGNCSDPFDQVVVIINPIPDVSIQGDNICDGQTATLTAIVNGGTSPFTYLWNTTEITSSISTNTSGVFNLTVTDSNGCTTSAQFTVNVDSGPSANAGNDMTICEGESATLTASATNGSSPYAFEWDNGLGAGASQTVSPTPSAFANETFIYTVTATDANGCTDVDQVSVTVLSIPDVTTASTNPTCGDDNGSITFTFPDHPDRASIEFSVDGGATYTLSSADNVGSVTLSDLDAGTYDLWVRWGNDACPIDLPDEILNDEIGPTVDAGEDLSVCGGGMFTLIANATGGTGAITYTWTPGNLSGASVNVSPTTTTTYTVTIEDENGCMANDQLTITVQPNLTSGISAPTTSCAGEGVQFVANPPIAGATYNWSFSGPATPSSSNLESVIVTWDDVPGIYTATLIVTNGACTETYTHDINITQEVFAVAGADVTVCQGASTQIGGSPTGPVGANYVWTPNLFLNDNTVSNPVATPPVTTTYTVQVTQNGCVRTESVTINVDVQLNPKPEAGPDIDICPGETANIGGDPDLNAIFYQWSTASGDIAGANSSFLEVTPNVTTKYYVTAFNNQGCPGVDSVIVTVNPLPVAEAGANETICEGESVDLTASASGGAAPYTFAWDNGLGAGANQTVSPTPSAFANETFIYTVTATDANGCTDIDQVSVTVLSTPDVTTTSTNPTCGDDNGSITFTFPDHPDRSSIEFSVDGGATYMISSADNAGSVTATDLDAGTYDLWVRWDNDECPLDIPNITLNDENSPTVIASDDTAICIGGSVSLSANATGGTGTITYTWMPGNLSSATINVSPTITTTYTLSIEDENGCTASEEVVVTVVDDPEVTISADGSDICEGGIVTFTATTSGGLDCQDVQWQFRLGTSGAWTNVATGDAYTSDAGLTAGTYQYRARYICNGTGCDTDNSNVITINVVADPTVDVSADDTEICVGGSTTLTATVTDGTGNISYQWQSRTGANAFANINGATNNIYTANALTETTDYQVVVTVDGTGCADPTSSVVTVTVVPDPVVIVTVNDEEFCEGGSTTMNATVTNGVGNISYQWQSRIGANAFANINGATASSYDTGALTETTDFRVIVSVDGVGCDDVNSDAVTVTITPDPSITINIDDVEICENDETTNLTATVNGGLDCSDVQWQFRSGTSGAWTNLATGATLTTDVNLIAGIYQYRAIYACGGVGCDDATSDPVTLTITAVASLGDFVWEDTDADGIQDTGENGIDNVTVNLLDESGNQIATTITAGGGFYNFDNLCAGNYIIEFINPGNGFIFTEQLNNDSKDPNDSDADENNGRTGIITLVPGEDDDSNDAGLYRSTSLGNFVWEDVDGDGIQDVGEPGIDGVTVNLLDENGNQIATTTTSGGGAYEFTGLLPGDYIVEFIKPNGFTPTPSNQGGDDALDSDADENTGQTGLINLESGETDDTNDAGFYRPASLGDFVWEDTNADGIQDAGEPGIDGVTVNLLDENGNQIATTTTSGGGAYEFTNLAPGNYIVEFIGPTGFE
ncbi:MAG: PKD domain-containing protein, partial [Saprospiraceae bacterium]|nr:PKD domain-containing protein [Saprospiraceae bacterium]